MRGADRSNSGSQSLLGAAALLATRDSPHSVEKEAAAVFPVKEEIYDYDYPELQELQRKLLHYLQEAAPTSPQRASAVGLLSLVKLELHERESCASILKNILSVQSSRSSHDGRGARTEKFPDAPVELAAAAAEDRKACLRAEAFKPVPKAPSPTSPSFEEPITSHTSTNPGRRKPFISPPAVAAHKDGSSLSVNSSVSPPNTVASLQNSHMDLNPASCTLQDASASSASRAYSLRLSIDYLHSTPPRPRVTKFADLEKKLFGEICPSVPTPSILPPAEVSRNDAQVACVPPLKALRRCRRRTCGTNPLPRSSTNDIQKKLRRRRCSTDLPLRGKVREAYSIERRSPKDAAQRRREKTTGKPTHGSDSAPRSVPVDETGCADTRGSPSEGGASTAPPTGQQNIPGDQEEPRVAVKQCTPLFSEDKSCAKGLKRQDALPKSPFEVQKTNVSRESEREGRPRVLAHCNSPTEQDAPTEAKGPAACEAPATSVSTTNDEKGNPNSANTSVKCEAGGLSPLSVDTSEERTAAPSQNPIVGNCCTLTESSSSSSSVKSVARAETGKDGETESANPTTPSEEAPFSARPSNPAPEEAAAQASSPPQRSTTHQDLGRQRFLRKATQSCTAGLQSRRAAQSGSDERGGRYRTRSVCCTGDVLPAKEVHARREEAARQRHGSTGITRKNVLMKPEKSGLTGSSASMFGEAYHVIEACVCHELAHMSIRNSAKIVIDDIDSVIQAMSQKAQEKEQQCEGNLPKSPASTVTSQAAPSGPEGLPANLASSSGESSTSPCMACSCTMDGDPKDLKSRNDPCYNRTTSTLPRTPTASSSMEAKFESNNELAENMHLKGNMKHAADTVENASTATMEKVYALLAGLNGPPLTESCADRNGPFQRTNQGGSAALGWRIQVGTEDGVDATCQTISIKKNQDNEEGCSCVLVEEMTLFAKGQALDNKNQRGKETEDSTSLKQESRTWTLPLQRKKHFILGHKRTPFSPEGGTAPLEECGTKDNHSLLLGIERQFPTLGDLLTECDKSKHVSILREILINNGKCCADLCQSDDSKNTQDAITAPQHECLTHCGARYYKVEKTRPEVFSIVCRALKKEEGWEPVPEGQHWEYGWNLLWTWRPPKINYNKLLSFQKVNHFPESRHLTRKDKLKECIEKYQKLAGKRSDLFKIIPKTYCMPKEHTSLFNDVCDAEDQKRRPIWICKPKDSSRGRGIYLASSLKEVKYTENILVQEYIANPLLLNGRKFDLRLYVLVTSFNPLEAFIYKQGFARVARVPFSLDPEHLGNRFMHLTNASVQTQWQNPSDSEEEGVLQEVFEVSSPPRNRIGVNSSAQEDEKDTEDGKSTSGESSKLLLDELRVRLEQGGLEWDMLWNRIILVILKSLSCCSDFIPFQTNSFELFGYDILIDAEAKPWLIEVNSSPCMSQEYDIDRKIKPALIEDTIRLVNPVRYNRFKLSNIIAGRLNEAAVVDHQGASVASPKRGQSSHPQGKVFSALRVCSPPNSTNSLLSMSSSSRRGPLTHRPSRKVTPDVRQGNEDWRRSRRTHVKQQHQQDLLTLLNHSIPREYGEIPTTMGNYERIAPSKAWYQLQMLKHSLQGRHQ